jgi:hypothetical protein
MRYALSAASTRSPPTPYGSAPSRPPDKQAAIEKGAKEFRTGAWRLYAIAKRSKSKNRAKKKLVSHNRDFNVTRA